MEKIKTKAEKENSYGNLLAVLLREVNHQEEIRTDSGKVFRERLDQNIAASNDGVIKTLYRVAKGDRIDIDSLLSSPDSAIYRQKDASLQWLPFFEKGKDSKIFNNDLLHVILVAGELTQPSEHGHRRDELRIDAVHQADVSHLVERDGLEMAQNLCHTFAVFECKGRQIHHSGKTFSVNG